MTDGSRWRWRGNVALLGVALAFVLYPLLPIDDVINSDWPAFATGARLIVNDPAHLYDFDAQRRVELQVTGGRTLVTLGIHGFLPFLAPAWVALLAVPFAALGTDAGGRLWIVFGLLCLIGGLYLATRPRPPTALLPAFASVPTALLMLNAQLDGVVALGIGGALALWSQPWWSGFVLGLTLVKPQLVLPVGFGLLVARRWKTLAGWAACGVMQLAATLAVNPHWVMQWLAQAGSTVQVGAREVNLAHFAVYLPASTETAGIVVLTLIAICGAVALAWRRYRRDKELGPAAAILVIGGVLASPHALPADLVLVALGLAIWDRAGWLEWLALSVAALAAAVVPAPAPAAIGALLIGWLTLRISAERRELSASPVTAR
ncbi:MAG TPA: glycosyltransferase family 87 protein [Candidatus Dormibacteraeota bacterium]|nr:glycosyltransferase family 87 protein [Candidatus Dormibacteraeota bacterium]